MDTNQVQQQAEQAAAKSYSFWQRAKDFTRNNPGTVLAIAAVIFVIGVVVL